MLKNFFRSFLVRRHFWRYASFSEVAEIYVSRTLRMAALYLSASFMSIYMFQIGYSVITIALFWAAYFFLKIFISLPIAQLVSWIGPKRSTLISNLLYIPPMIMFALLPEYGPWLLVPIAVLQGTSAGMYSVAYLVHFSKVKSIENAGKEIAFMNIFEKITRGVSPLIGGFIAYLWGPQVVLVIAAILFATAAAPLFASGEVMQVRQKLQFRGFPWRLFWGPAIGQFSTSFDAVSTGTVWTLYIAVVLFDIAANGNGVYAAMGALVSVVFVAAIVGSYTFGRLIDRRKGGDLMKAGAIAGAATHLIRPFIVSPVSVAGLNAASEFSSTATNMPFTRGVFDNADRSGSRTTYLGMNEVVANIGATVACLVLAGAAFMLGAEEGLRNYFYAAAAMVLLMLTVRFPLYKK